MTTVTQKQVPTESFTSTLPLNEQQKSAGFALDCAHVACTTRFHVWARV